MTYSAEEIDLSNPLPMNSFQRDTMIARDFALCFVWGLEGRVLEKRKEQVEKIEDIGRRGLWRLIFYL
ncbi:hypothetical protein MTR_1g014380 [Medicago truncatula]|uniref:Uncharacterized protein n=1 Tax=Medicago truncatula TaxID=3880 RepID=G7I8B0_MEDTR|nr:hypothetical protein MTR_1g014380 [Medicago truncatula]